MSECPYCQNTFEMQDTCSDEFRMWQGLQGPYYIPTVDEEGVLSWTNTGGLPNPDAVDISGPPGKGLTIKGVVATVGDLPANPEEGDTYLVGATDPYDGYIWLNGTWVELGDISKGEAGEGVPTGGTTGQVLKKASNADYDTEWGIAGEPATSAPLMDGTAAVGTSTKYAREDHVHPVYDQFVRPNLLDNWYFVGGGSQQGGGKFPINQRGQTSYSTEGYCVDRWRLPSGSTLTLQSAGVRIQSSASGQQFQQFLENYAVLDGKLLTLSVLWSDGALSTGSIIYDNSDADWDTHTFFYAKNERVLITKNHGVDFCAEDTVDATFVAIKLELGDTQTLAHQENGVWVLNEIPNFADELARCQRYFIGFDDANNYHWVAFGTMTTTTDAIVVMPTPVTMRTTPSVSFNDVNVQGDTTIWISTIGINIQSVNVNGIALLCTINGTYTAGAAVSLAAKKIFLSADL